MDWSSPLGSMGDAALRSIAVALLLRLAITVLRITNPHQEKIIWTTMLTGALLMPALLHWSWVPAFTPLHLSAPTVLIPNFGLGGYPRSYVGALGAAYAGVTSLLLLRMGFGAVRMCRIAANAQRIAEPWVSNLDVRVTSRLANPATFGTIILFPTNYTTWTEDKRSLILQHEESHVKHQDSRIQWLAGLHTCLFWFSPLAWWLRRRVSQLAEYVSDDSVLRMNPSRFDYAKVLLEQAETGSTGTSVSMGITGCSLEQRLERILAERQPEARPSRARRALAALSVLPIIALAGESTGLDNAAPRQALQGDGLPAEIIAAPPLEELEKYYPAQAKEKDIDGLVQITVTVDTAGRATDTHVLSEQPAGLGFAAAASELAHHFKYANTGNQPAYVTYKIRFALPHEPAGD